MKTRRPLSSRGRARGRLRGIGDVDVMGTGYSPRSTEGIMSMSGERKKEEEGGGSVGFGGN